MTAITEYLPIYDELFSGKPTHLSFEDLNSSDKDLIAPLSCRSSDFSLQDNAFNFQSAFEKTILFSSKIVIFPWGVYELSKYFVQRLVMIGLYPAQSKLMKFFFSNLIGEKALNAKRLEIAKSLKERGYIVRHVSLEKDNARYSGLLIGHKDTIYNGKWALQATGNMEPIERHAQGFAELYKNMQFNTLLINGPAAGSSKGHANPKSMGQAQELGLRFLETALKAKKIVLAGRSLGAASIGQAILSHVFQKDVDYLAISQMTFGTSSDACSKVLQDACGKLIGKIVKHLVIWSGCEMDHLLVSKKLQDLAIKEIVIQATKKEIPPFVIPNKEDFIHDDVIPASAGLGYHLVEENITENKIFIGLARELDPMTTLFHMTSLAASSPHDYIKAL